MTLAALFYLGTTVGLFVLFVVLVLRTYRRKHRDRLEEPKNRMLSDD